MDIEKFSLKIHDLRIQGEIYALSPAPQSFPALILCYGIPARTKEPDDRGYPLLAERFCREGFLFLIFNFRGAGLSGGNFDILGWAEDLDGILDYLMSRRDVDRRFTHPKASSYQFPARNHPINFDAQRSAT